MARKTAKEQVKSGVRKGLLWVFGICWLALTGAGIAIVTTSPPPPTILGWLLLVIAAAILVATMDRWKKIIAGVLAYGAVNCFVSIFSGHVTSNFSVHVSKSQAVIATLFLTASAALCVRFIDHELSLADRLALFLLVAGIFVQAARPQFEAISLAVGLASLALAWIYDYIVRRRRSSRSRSPSDQVVA